MSTKTLIDFLVDECDDGWQRSTGSRSLLKMIERGQDLLFQGLGKKRVYNDPATGFPPYLTTVDSQYQYEIKAANLSAASLTVSLNGTTYTITADLVTKIFIDIQKDYGIEIRYLGEPYMYREENPYYSGYNRLYVANIPCDSMPAMENTNPTVTFKDNPGASTAKFFCEFLYRPPRLTAETIPLCIPEKFEDALIDYVKARIEESAHGGMSDLMKRFHDFWVPTFNKEFNRGTSSGVTRMQPLHW